MDEKRSESVVKVFCDLYEKGLIYRGLRMVNWDPQNRTAISDDEVFFEQEQSKLYYLRYYVADDDMSGSTGAEEEVIHTDAAGRRYAVVATTRPETIMGDTAMCINPKDPKNTWLKGKKVVVPLVGRVVPVIEDRYVDIEFGTGCLKVTPAHDKNDNMLGKSHNLDTIDIFNEDGTVAEIAGMYVGMDRFDCRKAIAEDLEKAGLMEKVEDYVNNVGLSERTKVPIEPRLSLQWFIDMKHFAEISLKPVMDDVIRFVPEKYKTTYRMWLENIQDWCISRQLWWGHRIPAYYYTDPADGEEKFVVAENKDKALGKVHTIDSCIGLCIEDLRQDEGALDTWFSSWLWPITLFDGINNPGNEEIKYYYPTATLVTGPDIIFFWVARMIMAGYEYVGKQPFDNVYFTGIVRDAIGRKMSKSLGNSPDPLDLIETYGADGVRMGMMLAAPAGNDIMYDDKLCETGRNFCNKIWNAFRLVAGWDTDDSLPQPSVNALAERWMRSRISATMAEVNDCFDKFRLNDALMAVYRLFRDDFSGYYLEMVKPAYQKPVDGATLRATNSFFDELLRMLHPFMPFITEELWQHLADRRPGESIMYAPMPAAGEPDDSLLRAMESAQEVVGGVRAVRAKKNIPAKEELRLLVLGDFDVAVHDVVRKLANVSEITLHAEKDAAAMSFLVGTTEFEVPMASNIDVEAELARLHKEYEYYKGFKASVEKKLSNERFVGNAPAAVVENERNKLADAEQKLASIAASIAALEA